MKEYRKKGHSVAQILSDVDQSMQVISVYTEGILGHL